jgi:glycosyltransferase involved in cell wall biosynthesis
MASSSRWLKKPRRVCVPPDDSQALVSTIKELATNKQKCRTMGLNGRKMIQSGYSREDVANRFAAILETMRSKKDG